MILVVLLRIAVVTTTGTVVYSTILRFFVQRDTASNRNQILNESETRSIFIFNMQQAYERCEQLLIVIVPGYSRNFWRNQYYTQQSCERCKNAALFNTLIRTLEIQLVASLFTTLLYRSFAKSQTLRPSLTSQTDWFYKLIDQSEISAPKSNPKLYKLDPPAVWVCLWNNQEFS